MLMNISSKIILLLVLTVNCFKIGTCCTDNEWTCDSGQCIAADELCDGQKHCKDGSDETAEACIQQSCPSFAFRCAYGACVPGSAKCDGISDCADNSDETASLCPDLYDDFLNTIPQKSKCEEDQFTCTSGQCINLDNACDGRSDCEDQSDETVEACASSNCPSFAFRCGYGACIESDKRCNGFPDCRDGSDENLKLCKNTPTTSSPPVTPTRPGPTKPTQRPPVTRPTRPTKPPVQGCIAPNISNGVLRYENEPTRIIRPGESIADYTSMKYECHSGYVLEGPQFNLCHHSHWSQELHGTCIKYCPKDVLKGVTFKVECSDKNHATISCGDRIKPGTYARVSCQEKYRKPDHNPPDILVCQEDGQWDYIPYRCVPVCGEELLLTKPFSVNGVETNITYVPWHVGIYQNFDGSKYKHVCGGTIISAKVVISAAHCFWDAANEQMYDKSFYVVAGGKFYRDYYADEPNSKKKNIADISIPNNFGQVEDFRNDIAVIVLADFLKFSSFIAAVCIDWKKGAAKSIPNNVIGKIAGWGRDNSGDFSKTLRAIEVPSKSYSDCRTEVGTQLSGAVSEDKFCVLNEFGAVVCQGDSGGGFVEKRFVNGKYTNYLWGVVSGGVPLGKTCAEYTFVTYTNIQYYENLINDRLISNRPK